jgi:hypothetical protein
MAIQENTRNPLIDDDPVETAGNIRAVLAFLQGENQSDEREWTHGRHMILEVLRGAADSLSETLSAR